MDKLLISVVSLNEGDESIMLCHRDVAKAIICDNVIRGHNNDSSPILNVPVTETLANKLFERKELYQMRKEHDKREVRNYVSVNSLTVEFTPNLNPSSQ